MQVSKPGKKLKQKRARECDIDYMKWVIEHNCIVPACGSFPTEAHHSIHKSQLGSDHSCVPLCPRCHSLYHMKHGSVASFEKALGVNLITESEKLYAVYVKKTS